jgi:hypothetical protein
MCNQSELILCRIIALQTAVKMLYPFLSLPAPVSSSTGSGEDANDIFPAYPDVVEESQVQKLLLLGYEGSGRSTIFKQVSDWICSHVLSSMSSTACLLSASQHHDLVFPLIIEMQQKLRTWLLV